MRKLIGYFFASIGIFVVSMILIMMVVTAVGIGSIFNGNDVRLREDSVLLLELNGIIEDGDKFLEKLRRYREDDNIKGVLVQINSPGGVVGPSQEIFMELKRTREVFKKPVVVSCLGLAASGAYYAALAADKIVVTPGCMIGSIGVIMQFANIEKLLAWAKIDRYALKTGKFKDTGAEYRQMTGEERELLQELLSDVLLQFKTDIMSSRKLTQGVVDANSDGRVFTGQMAVKLGFADSVGTLDDARKILGEMVGLGPDPEIFKPRGRMRGEDWLSLFEEEAGSKSWLGALESTFHLKIQGQPLLIWPGALGR
jgi:protease IV